MEMINPERTAILLIGYQRDYFDAEGKLSAVIEESNQVSGIREHTEIVLNAVKATPMTIVSTPISFSETYQEMENPIGILKTIRDVEAFKAGTWGAETIDLITQFGDRIKEIPGKQGFDAFSNTDLSATLKSKNIDRVVIIGTVTSICVNATAMRAFDDGYAVTILSDCTSGRTTVEQDFFCTEVFPLFADVCDHKTFLERLGVPA